MPSISAAPAVRVAPGSAAAAAPKAAPADPFAAVLEEALVDGIAAEPAPTAAAPTPGASRKDPGKDGAKDKDPKGPKDAASALNLLALAAAPAPAATDPLPGARALNITADAAPAGDSKDSTLPAPMTAPAPQFAPLGGAAGQPSDAAPADEEIPAVPARLTPAAARSGIRRTLTPGGDPPANGSPASEIHELHRASGAPARPVAASMPKIDVDPQTGPERTAPEAFALHIKAAEAAAHTESKAAAVKPLPATARRTPAAADVSESPRPKESKKADAAPQKTQAAADTARHKGAATNGQAHEERENREDRNDAPVKPSAPASFKTAVAEHADPAAPLARPAATAIDPAAAAPKTETADPRPARAPEAPSAPAPVPQESVESKSPVRAAQEISLRVGADSKVEIRVSDRAGEVHVSVRTPDEALARAMREDLGSLTGKLAQAGYETAAPSGAAGMDSHHPGENRNTGQQDTPQHGGSGNSQQQQQQRQEGEGRGRRPATFEEFSQFMSNRSTEKTEK